MAKITDHLTEYGKSSSVKGLSRVIKSKSWILKCLWLVSIITGATVAGYQTTLFIRKYLEYSTLTKISICNDCHPPFPDITLCNLNPLALVNGQEIRHIQFGDYLKYVKEMQQNANISHIKKNLNLNIRDLEDIEGVLYSLAGYFQNLNIQKSMDSFSWGNSTRRLVHSCDWYDWDDQLYEKENCKLSSQKFHISPEYFICTTLHSNGSGRTNSISQVKGLEAVLYLNDFSEQLMPVYEQHILRSQAKGVRIIIHPHGTLPKTSRGFNIPPGHEVTVHLAANQYKRMEKPYSDCTKRRWIEEDDDFADEKHVYTDSAAEAICRQEHNLKKCRCFHPFLPVNEQLLEKYKDLPGCNQFLNFNTENISVNQQEATDVFDRISCYFFNEEDTGLDPESCDFKQACEEYKYDYRVSNSPWPHEAHQIAFYCDYIDTACGADTDLWDAESSYSEATFKGHFHVYKDIVKLNMENKSSLALQKLRETDLISRNFIQLKVMFSDTGLVKYTEEPAIPTEMFFGTMGGMLNLWIGITFFTIVEIFDLCFTIAVDTCCRNEEPAKAVNEHSNSNCHQNHSMGSPFNTQFNSQYT